jgi:hypothetical protein
MDHQLQEERIRTPQNMWSLLEKGGWAGHQRESSVLRVFQVKVQTDAGSTSKYSRYTEHGTPVK